MIFMMVSDFYEGFINLQNIVENLNEQVFFIKDFDKFLQDTDVNRLRVVVYRDVVSYIIVFNVFYVIQFYLL